MAKVMDDLWEHPDVLRTQKYGYPRKPMPDCFPKPKAVELFEDLEDDLKWDIRRYESIVDNLKESHYPSVVAEDALDMLRQRLEVVQEQKKSAHEV